MAVLLKGAKVFDIESGFKINDILISDGVIAEVGASLDFPDAQIVDLTNKYIFPGFVDVHVHFREPGFSYKETVRTGSLAAAHGGYTAVCAMPNLNPCPDSAKNLAVEQKIIDSDACIAVYPYGAITKDEKGEVLSDMDDISDKVIAFSDDGRGVQGEEMMLAAMKKAHGLGKIIASHCEVNELLRGGYIHDGVYAEKHGHKGICSESEWRQIERDIELCKKTGCAYHVCHVSSKESVELIRKAKKDGVDITSETAPHYLVLNDLMLIDDGAYKMNPPIRSESDRKALIDGLLDGTVDMIATDHAPHSAEEKSRGLKNSVMGITGLETSFPILYTKLVRTGVISLEKLIELMSVKPAERFGIESAGEIKKGASANLCVFELENEYTIDSNNFLSMGKSTPFDGEKVYGKCIMTFFKGKTVYVEVQNG